MTTLKNMCRDGRLHAGHFVVEFATPGIDHILAGAGAAFCFLDMEHSGFSFETVKATLRHLDGAGVPTFLRVPSKAYDHVARALDMGAEGVMVPMLGTAEEAAALVRHAKYTPEGARNADAIAATPGVDCVWVGHFDLSASLGVPGDFACRPYRDTLKTICATAKRHGKALGRLVGGMAEAEEAVRESFTLIAYGGDISLLQAAVAEGVRGIAALESTR